MAFFGASIKGNSTYTLKPEAEVLHLSHACLSKAKAGKSHLKVKVNGQTLNVACLDEKCQPMTNLDLFFNCDPNQKPVEFSCVGDSSIDITGYWEPLGDDADSDMDMPMVGEDNEELSEEESVRQFSIQICFSCSRWGFHAWERKWFRFWSLSIHRGAEN